MQSLIGNSMSKYTISFDNSHHQQVKYEKGDVVYYKNTSRATVLAVIPDLEDAYYVIKLSDGTERHTTGGHLSQVGLCDTPIIPCA